jgi:hypothetical protein
MSDIPSINYTNRDFESIKEALKVHLQTKFGSQWKDFYTSGIGMALVEQIAYVFDVLSFYLDVTANEQFLGTARDRASIVKHGERVGYIMRPATGAAVEVEATIAAAQAQDVIIPEGTTITTAKGVTFRTAEQQRISAGSLSATLVFVEGQVHSQSAVSDGSSFQRVTLSQPNVIFGAAAVDVDGSDWERIDSLVYGDGSSLVYDLSYDENGYATLRFGDGESGAVPPIGATITITYRTGGGVIGNIRSGELDTDINGYLDGVLPTSYVSVSLYNEEPGAGGEERETIEHAKLWIPQWVKTNGRAVTAQDFDTLANTFNDTIYGSPAYAKAVLHQKVPEYNLVDIYLWARDHSGAITTPSVGLKNAVETYFNNNGVGAVRTICTDVDVLDGEIVYVDIALEIKLLSNFASSSVVSEVSAALDSLFGTDAVQPGVDLNLSHIYKAVQRIAGVDHALVVSVIGAKSTSELIGVGDGANPTFSPTLSLPPSLPIAPFSVSLTDGAQTITDDGEGNLVGDVGVGTNTVDYATGDVNVTFATPPALAAEVYCAFKYILDYQRGGVEATGNGTTSRFRGVLEFPPIVPLDPTTSQKGIAFTDGTQVVVDDGDGNLVGDVHAGGSNYIDYSTGAFDFTFTLPPAVGTSIQSTYRQMLRVDSENLPIDDTQLAVKNRYTITTL